MSRLDWENEARPVLVAILRANEKAGEVYPNVEGEMVNAELGREADDDRINHVLPSLRSAGYINGDVASGPSWSFLTLEEKGLQEVAGWPGRPGQDFYSQLVDVLDERIDGAEDEEERGRLQQFRDAVTRVGTQVVSNVLSDLATRGL